MQPNIIVFLSDQQRFDTLGCNGQPLPVTPHLDRFALSAVNYLHAYTPQPVCGPARAALQTGLYPTQTGCFKNGVSLPLDQDTIARRMRRAGYRVAYVGKWHLASDMTENHYERIAVPPQRRGGYDDYWVASDLLEFTSHGYGGHMFDRHGSRVTFDGYRTDCVTDYALRYLETYDYKQPFFLFLSHIEPHHQNDRNAFEGPEGSRERFQGFAPPDDLRGRAGDWERWYPDYLGCCNALDRNFGRVLEALAKRNMLDNTLLVYTSDHGCHFRTRLDEAVPGGFDDYKRNGFEGTVHVPLLIGGPGFARGKREDRLVSLMDLPKTLMAAAGCDIPEAVQGRALQAMGEDWENEVYIQISESFVGRALRTERYKYVIHAPGKDPLRDTGSDVYRVKYLFDLQSDPLETRNCLDDPRYAEVLKTLETKILRHAKQAQEPPFRIV